MDAVLKGPITSFLSSAGGHGVCWSLGDGEERRRGIDGYLSDPQGTMPRDTETAACSNTQDLNRQLAKAKEELKLQARRQEK